MLDAPHLTFYPELVQGSDEWLAARCGLLTASEMKLILTPTLKIARNEKTRAHVYEIAAQRITSYVEPTYIGDEMLRGYDDEVYARAAYAEHFAPVREVGFIVNRKWGFPIGYSPDGLVGENGGIEVKSRRQKFQIEFISDHMREGTIPADYVIQVQTGMLVAELEWIDFISYSGGLPMGVVRCHPDPKIQNAIIEAAASFEDSVTEKIAAFRAAQAGGARLVPTERRVVQEMFV